jgi:PAS domain S-box-containing protein
MSQIGAPLAGSYDYAEVARSIFIAFAASYAALDLGGRVTAARGWARAAWLTGGAIAMGIGIWAMHFKGILAFRLPLTVDYHWPTILLSLGIAVFASAIALFVATRQKMGPVQAWTGSLIMGGGVAAMHYVGMAAMRMAAVARFNPLLVALSVVLAILFSRIALMFTFDYREDFRGTTLAKVTSAAVMGAAISVMHYTGMAAVSFMPARAFPNLSHTVSISPFGNNGIAIVTLLVLGTAILTSSVDRQTHAELQRLNELLEQRVVERTKQLTAANEELGREIAEFQRAEQELRQAEEHIRAILEYSPNWIFLKDTEGHYLLVNREIERVFGISQEQIKGKTDSEIFPPELATEYRANDLKVLRAGLTMEFEEIALLEDGQHTSIVHKFPLLDTHGNIYATGGVATDITERVRAERELRRLSGELLRSQDEERRRIARDLHDSTGQDLVALTTMLGQLGGSISPRDRKSRGLLSECKALAEQCIREIRTLSYLLHPPVLDHAGLGDAIREYVDGFTKRSGIQVKLELSSELGRIPRDVELALFRVVQESLTNAQRHSSSQQAKIRIDRGSSLMLEISDGERAALVYELPSEDALNFKVGVGILSMQERVKSIGGRLDIDSTARGTTVRVTVPLGGEKHEKTAHSDR